MKNLIALLLIIGAYSSQGQTHKCKIKSMQSKPIVELTLNGKKAYFIIDTGADVSVINSSMATKFGFELVKDYTQYSAKGFSDQEHKFQKVKKASVMLDSIQMRTDFYAFNLDNLAQSIEQRTNYRIVGIIGADLLMRYGFVIDYGTRMVHVAMK